MADCCKKVIVTGLMTLVLVVILNISSWAASSYKITDVGTLGGSLNSTQAWDLNDSGQVVGRSFNSLAAPSYTDFLWSGGFIQSLNIKSTPNGVVGINAKGQIVGDGFNGNHAFLRDTDGSVRDLGGLSGGVTSSANGINASGQVVGISDVIVSGVSQRHGFIWDATHGMQDLGSLGGLSSARRINEVGQVVGYYIGSAGKQNSYIWDRNTGMQALRITGGGNRANGLNDHGEVVGQSKDGFGAFAWNAGSGLIGLPALVTGERIYAYDINNAGQIVGYGGGGSRMGDRAVIWNFNPDGSVTATDLNTIVPVDGWVLGAATAINEKGEITGFMRQSNGPATHAFLLTPVPLPPAVLMFAPGFIGMAFATRRRQDKSTRPLS